MVATIAIVGRPNVGKSTLFNRLLGQKRAIVHDRPGVTRDRNYGACSWYGHSLLLVDTGGFEPEGEGLLGAMRAQVEAAIAEADVLVFVLDRQTGLTPPDELAAAILRRAQKPVILAVNKVDAQVHTDDLGEFWKLGFSDLHPISAEHARGVDGLMEAVIAALPAGTEEPDVLDDGGGEEQEDGQEDGDIVAAAPSEIRIAILGRPNIGKSTLANRLIGAERHLVHDAPGTTVDAIDSTFEALGQPWRIVDTAGIRRRARIYDDLEGFAVAQAIRTIERCHLVLLMIDGTEPPATQDARLAHLAQDRGRGVIVVVNRWDLVRELPDRNAPVVEAELEQTLPHLTWAPRLYVSALTGKGCHRILPKALEIFAEFDKRIPTPEINRFLREIEAHTPPPQFHHHPVRMHFMKQARVRPPTFDLFCNTPEGLSATYRRFLVNALRTRYGFEGSPIRLHIKQKRKPGAEK
ncbi:MAG: ribosome biogenesis GTPase Der [Pseudomonadota bacterium]